MVIIPAGFGGMADGIPEGMLGGITMGPADVGTIVGFRSCIELLFRGALKLSDVRGVGDTDRVSR